MAVLISAPQDRIPIICTKTVLIPGLANKVKITSKEQIDVFQGTPESEDKTKVIGFVPSLDGKVIDDIGTVGTLGIVRKLAVGVDEPKLLLAVAGMRRFTIQGPCQDSQYPIKLIEDKMDNKTDEARELWEVLLLNMPKLIRKLLSLGVPPIIIVKSDSNTLLIDICADILTANFEERFNILNNLNPLDRLKKTVDLIAKIEDVDLSERMPLRRTPSSESLKYEERIKTAKLTDAARKVAEEEVSKLKKMSRDNSERTVTCSYLDLILSLPWCVSSSKDINISEAKKILDKDHYAMDEVKTRVLEYLAVKSLKNDSLNAPILCFVGPPGVGKTSIGKSVANILGRKFERISLGGVTNPSVIRGNRKVYVGSMCGRIIQALKQAGTNNPVILLDEIDKMNALGQGNPSSALLEVLDPEQNSHFVDNYLNIPFDLSQVIFMATANLLKTVQPALIDRMEVIQVEGYSTEERCEIVKNYLLPKQITLHGLKPEYFSLPDESIDCLIRNYTHESGVRNAERKIAAICRNIALAITEDDKIELPINIDKNKIVDIFGKEKFWENTLEGCLAGILPGTVIMLSCNIYGGKTTVVEAKKIPNGRNKLVLTGSLGRVLKESAKISHTWVQVNAPLYGIKESKNVDVHVHLPAGSTPKEGPSAGITVATALMSLFAGIPVIPDLAMTGELSLQGQVLPVGGVKKKIQAAIRNGIKKVILPLKCKPQLENIKELDKIEIVFVEQMSEVIHTAFGGQLTKVNAKL